MAAGPTCQLCGQEGYPFPVETAFPGARHLPLTMGKVVEPLCVPRPPPTGLELDPLISIKSLWGIQGVGA